MGVIERLGDWYLACVREGLELRIRIPRTRALMSWSETGRCTTSPKEYKSCLIAAVRWAVINRTDRSRSFNCFKTSSPQTADILISTNNQVAAALSICLRASLAGANC